MSDFSNTKWFYFEDGSNPYGVLGSRQDLFFKMVVSWQPEMIDADRFQCPKKPTAAYYKPQGYQFKRPPLWSLLKSISGRHPKLLYHMKTWLFSEAFSKSTEGSTDF